MAKKEVRFNDEIDRVRHQFERVMHDMKKAIDDFVAVNMRVVDDEVAAMTPAQRELYQSLVDKDVPLFDAVIQAQDITRKG